MYALFVLYALYVNAAGESCKTPDGQLGDCVPVRSCNSLLWSFTNPKDGLDKYLQQFFCSNELGLNVCCRRASDYLVFEDEKDNYDPNDITNVKLINAKNCGISHNLQTYNGVVHLQDFPWLVKIMTVNNSYKRQDRVENVGCTGVLINNLYVLFSAQCHNIVLTDLDNYVKIDFHADKQQHCNGTSYSSKCITFENYEIDAKTIHPFYDPQTQLNNIAILRLSRRVQYSDTIRPICLPIHIKPLKLGYNLQTAGWNRTYRLNDTSVKNTWASVSISNVDCRNRLLINDSNVLLSLYEMCTEQKDSSDVNGFPLMSLVDNQWYLQGFESVGGITKVYTRTQNYLQWIQEAMGGERCLTPYNQTAECMYLENCPKLRDRFANASPKDEEILRKFICEYEGEDPNDETYILKVCCKLESDFIIPPETDTNLNFEISNFKYCGLQHRDDYISTNERISVDEFPWLGVIVNATLLDQRDVICGGTLITHKYVLTSGLCSYSFNENDTMLVRFGEYHLKNSTDCVEFVLGLYECADIQEFEVETETIHPFFNEFNYINDISLLRLKKSVVFTDYVRPICLPRSENDLASHGTILYTTGFGENRQGEETKIKKKIRTTLISNDICKERLKLLSYITPITPYQICTEDDKNSTDVTCAGDVGGPVMHSKKLRWFIEGISSSYSCGDDEPQTHLNVFKYIKWIKLNIKN